MVVDSTLVLPRATQPASFTGLMWLYESNYIRLGSLLPEISDLADKKAGQWVSHVASDCALYLRIVERARYTTTLHLTYYFDENGDRVADPDLYVRIYHDARMAEVMTCSSKHIHRSLKPFETTGCSEMKLRWNRNMMLNKWLDYCAEKRHSFVCASEVNDPVAGTE
jgi:uncharacterized protein YqiB (DUF1249 family)